VSLSAHELGFSSLDSLEGLDALCLFVPEDERPLQGTAGFVDWRLCGALSRVLQQGWFKGAACDCLLLPSGGRLSMPRIFAIGTGSTRMLDAQLLGDLFSKAAEVLSRAKVEGVALEVPGARSLEESTRASALLNQFVPQFRGNRVAVISDKPLIRVLSSVRPTREVGSKLPHQN
jgi:Cytosol aminopeptidase family, N-terminal domain